jgi:hypothetical protein
MRRYYPVVQGTHEWHAFRDSAAFIRASEASSLIGLNPYKSSNEAVMELRAAMLSKPHIHPPMSEFMRHHVERGHRLEPLALLRLRPLFSKLEKCGVCVNETGGMRFLASPDGIAVTPEGERVLIEIKAPEARDAPLRLGYVVQLLVQMFCTGIQRGLLVYVWERDMRVWEVEWSDELWTQMVEWFKMSWMRAQYGCDQKVRMPAGERAVREALIAAVTAQNDEVPQSVAAAQEIRRTDTAPKKIKVY